MARSGAIYQPFRKERHVLVTPLTPQECRARLLAEIQPKGPLDLLSTASSKQFTIRLDPIERRWERRISTEAFGRFRAEPNETSIDVDIRVARAYVLLAAVVLSFVALLVVLLAVGAARRDSAVLSSLAPAGAFALLFEAALLSAVYVLQRWRARSEGAKLIEFLCEKLMAREMVT